jgi:hypothetical protein
MDADWPRSRLSLVLPEVELEEFDAFDIIGEVGIEGSKKKQFGLIGHLLGRGAGDGPSRHLGERLSGGRPK